MRPRTKRWLPLMVAGAVVVTATAAGIVTLKVAAPEGPQPWQALPSSTAGFVAVDLDPALSQKVEALKLVKTTGAKTTDLTAAVNDTLLGGTTYGVPSDHLKKWAGPRAAAAVALDVAGSLIPTPVSVLSVQDQNAMRADLAALSTDRGTDSFGYATVGTDFVVVTTSQDAADAIAAEASSSPLSANATFTADVADLPEDRVATVWTDLKLLDEAVATAPDNSALPALGLLPGIGSKASTGRAAAAAVFDNGTLELSAFAHGWKVGGQPVVPTTGSSAELISTMPSTTVAAGGIANLGAHVEAWYNDLPKEQKAQWDDRASTLGLILPGDLKAAFGTKTAVALTAPPANEPGAAGGYVLRSTSDDPVSAYRAVQAYAQQVAFPATGLVWDVQLDGSEVVAGTDEDFVAKTVAGGTLGKADSFTRVLPQTDNAAMLLWADLPKLATALSVPLKTPVGTLTLPAGSAQRAANLGPIGIWVGKSSPAGDTQMRVRLDLR